MSIQDAMLRLRNKHDLTQRQFADRVGLSQAAIHQYEKGRTTPRAGTIAVIAAEFGEDPRPLLRAAGYMPDAEAEAPLREAHLVASVTGHRAAGDLGEAEPSADDDWRHSVESRLLGLEEAVASLLVSSTEEGMQEDDVHRIVEQHLRDYESKSITVTSAFPGKLDRKALITSKSAGGRLRRVKSGAPPSIAEEVELA